MQELIQKAKELLDNKEVDLLIGYQSDGDKKTKPLLVKNSQQAEKLVFNEYCVNNLTTYLKRSDVKKLKKVAIVAKGCDIRALVMLITENQINLVLNSLDRKINSPLTSSCGRLFDAVAAMAGIRNDVTYEGQAAVEFEQTMAAEVSEKYSFHIRPPFSSMLLPVILDSFITGKLSKICYYPELIHVEVERTRCFKFITLNKEGDKVKIFIHNCII